MNEEPTSIDISSNVVNFSDYQGSTDSSVEEDNPSIESAPMIVFDKNHGELLRLQSDGKLIIHPDNVDQAAQQLVMAVRDMCVHIGSENPFKDAHTFHLEEEKRRMENRIELLEDALRKSALHATLFEVALKDISEKGGGEFNGHQLTQDMAMFGRAVAENIAKETTKQIALADVRPLGEIIDASEDKKEG